MHLRYLIFGFAFFFISSLTILGQGETGQVLINKGSVWKYLDNGSNQGSAWRSLDFDDSGWEEGNAILGYGRDGLSTTLDYGGDASNKYITYYFRYIFNIQATEDYNMLIGSILRDDGAVIYLNGNEVARSNMPALSDYQTLANQGVGSNDANTYFPVTINPDNLISGNNILAIEVHQYDPSSSDIGFDFEMIGSYEVSSGFYINEVLAINSSQGLDPDNNNFVDWIEIYNSNIAPVDLSGYYLTDNLNRLNKWEIPAGTIVPSGGYLMFWADGLDVDYHLNFRLDADGEEIAIVSPEGLIMDSLSFNKQLVDVSLGRDPSKDNQWMYFDTPSPGNLNIGGVQTNLRADKPVVSLTGGYFASSINVSLSAIDPYLDIKYTLDGKTPDIQSSSYNGSLNINSTKVLKARSYKSGLLPSEVVTQSYIIGETFSLPVISIATDPDFLYDDDIGIYLRENVSDRKEWERPGTLEFYEEDGSLGFFSNIDMRLFGRGAIRFDQKSLAIFARETDGQRDINYQLFNDVPIQTFRSFILRSSSDDWSDTMFRDALSHTVIKNEVNIDRMAYRPSILFINGEYYGIHNIREKYNENYLVSHHGVDPNNIDLLFVNNDYTPQEVEIKSGDDGFYWGMIDFANNYDLSIKENYDLISTMMDIDNYIDYIIVESITANKSWLHNRRVWRSKIGDGKFRWLIFDLDYGFKYLDKKVLEGIAYRDPIFKALKQNEEFKNKFVQRWAYFSSTTFAPERVIPIIDSLQANIDAEISRHTSIWGDKGGVENYNAWLGFVQDMRDWSNQRTPVTDTHLNAVFGTSEKSNLELLVDPPGSGNITLDDININSDNFSGVFYKNIPLNLRAIPEPGYVFDGWFGSITDDTLLINEGSVWNYLDDGSNQGNNWYIHGFDDSSWKTGEAEFGYGDGDETTVVEFGLSGNKHITTYFRKSFNIQDHSQFHSLIVDLKRDDGGVVYLNGTEVFRSNMPDGNIDYKTLAEVAQWPAVENNFWSQEIDPGLLLEGQNVIAVEIHQEPAATSDCSFDLKLRANQYSAASDNPIIIELSTQNNSYMARFNQSGDTPIIISEINYNPSEYQGGSPYEFLEIFNSGSASINLYGYSFSTGIEFEFPQGSSISPGESIILTKNLNSYSNLTSQVFEWTDGSLSDMGETITLVNNLGVIVDMVSYGINSPWPVEANGQGYSLELLDPEKDNSIGENWRASSEYGGTPGESSSSNIISGLYINEYLSAPGNNTGIQTDWIELYNSNNFEINIGGLYISDDPDNPGLWQIPENNAKITTIPPMGFLILFANDLTQLNILNVGFKLSNNGDDIILSQKVGDIFQIIDQVSFVYQREGLSTGKVPDGSNNTASFEIPSPGSSNKISTKTIIAPSIINKDDLLPVIVRFYNEEGDIDKSISGTFIVNSGSAVLENDTINVKYGVGSLTTKVYATSNFDLSIQGYPEKKSITIDSLPIRSRSGELTIDETWYSGFDYHIIDDFTVNENVNLTIEAGVRLIISSRVLVKVFGNLKVNGTYSNPVIFMPKDTLNRWSGLVLDNHEGTFDLNYAIFTGGGYQRYNFGHSSSQPIIMASYSKMNIDNCFIIDNIGKAFGSERSIINISNSVISRCDTGGEFRFSLTNVSDSWWMELPDDNLATLDDDNDALYFWWTPYQEDIEIPFIKDKNVFHPIDEITPSKAINNVFYLVEDDAIDMQKAIVNIEGCIMDEINNKGVSAGWWSTCYAERNLFINSGIGFSSSFWTYAYLDHNTFHNNYWSVKGFYGGGAEVKNSILSGTRSSNQAYTDNPPLSIYFNYCLSTTDSLPGDNNIYVPPGTNLFISPGNGIYKLPASSPAVNTGDPSSDPDPDGSVTDMGYYPAGSSSNIIDVIINEIYYNPTPDQGNDEDYEFIEVYNPTNQIIDLSGYNITDGIDFIFPEQVLIDPGEFIVIARNKSKYGHIDGKLFEWDNGGLSNQGENIALNNREGILVDQVNYFDNSPWPPDADGDGFSLELKSPLLDNNLPGSWKASSQLGGSPGDYSKDYDYTKLRINEFMVDNQSIHKDEYGIYNDWIEIYNMGESPIDIGGLYISDSYMDPLFWRIPFSNQGETLIPAGGFILLYPDNEPEKGVRHLNFGLSRTGEQIVLSRNVDGNPVIIDSYEFQEQQPDISTGRSGDGTDEWQVFENPTPGRMNIISSRNIITMNNMRSGEKLPIIIQYFDEDGNLDTDMFGTKRILLDPGVDIENQDIYVHHGIGTITTEINSDNNFNLLLEGTSRAFMN